MHLQRVVVPGNQAESWTVLGDGGRVVEPVERWLFARDELPVALTDMTRLPPAADERESYGQARMKEYNIRGIDYLTSCSTCHR